MARSTKAEVMRRVGVVSPLVCDCLTLAEIRAYVDRSTPWGASVSDSTLKYYARLARREIREAALIDRRLEIGLAKARLERVVARASARGDLKTMLVAIRQIIDLLGLAEPPRYEISGPQGGPISVEQQDVKEQLLAKLMRVASEEGSQDAEAPAAGVGSRPASGAPRARGGASG